MGSYMVLGGFHKISLIDYPSTVSCVLFVSGCNFDCPYCHNPELVKGNISRLIHIDTKYVCDLLRRRKGLLGGVVISGGEPTIQKDLARLCEEIKKIGYPIKLDTNGSRPQVLKQLVEDGLIDYIAMDIKTDPFHYSPLISKDISADALLSSIQIIMKSAPAYEFRTTCVQPLVNEQTIGRIANIINGATLYVLQRFHRTKVLHPEFFREPRQAYDDSGLERLKAIAEAWVESCIVR